MSNSQVNAALTELFPSAPYRRRQSNKKRTLAGNPEEDPMNEQQPRAVRPARLLGTAAAVAAAITIAAYGSSAPNRSTAPSPTSSPTGAANASTGSGSTSTSSTLAFSNCMRSHGVPNFPDPKVVSNHGGNQVDYLPGINLRSPAVEAAAKACGGFGPKGP